MSSFQANDDEDKILKNSVSNSNDKNENLSNNSSELEIKHRDYVDKLRSEKKTVNDDPFTQGLLLVRKCK